MKRILIIFALCFSVGLIYLTYRFIGLVPSTKSDLAIVGIDISHWNPVYDWKKVKQNSDFCIIKATEGDRCRDPKFKSYWNSCEKLKITKGAYHFFKPGVPAEKQFNNFKRNVKLSAGDFPPVLDVEVWKGTDMKEVNKWLELAEAHYGVKPIIYAGYYFYRAKIEGRLNSDYPLWIYFNHRTGAKPSFVNADCVLWQYNQKGKMAGISGDIDMDAVCNASGSLSNILIP